MRQQGSISRHALLKSGRWTLLLVGLLLGNLAQAATNYIFSPNAALEILPIGCSISTPDSYSCGVLTLARNDTITLSGFSEPVTITFSGAFTTGASNVINESGTADDLKLVTKGVLTLGASTVLNANVVGTTAVNLGRKSKLTGNLITTTTTGIVTLEGDSQVGGFISSQEGAINLYEDVSVGGAISTSAGAVTVGYRSRVGGGISTGAGAVELMTNVKVGLGITTEAGGIAVGDHSTIGGPITSTGAGVVELKTNVKVDGGITTEAGGITVRDHSTIGGPITSTGAGVVELKTNIKVDGGITTKAGGITVGDHSTIGGPITSTGEGVVVLKTNITVNGGISTVAGGITVGDKSQVCGSISSTGAGVVVLTTHISVGGSVTTKVGAITIGTGSTVRVDVISGGVTTLTGVLIGGNVSSIGAGAITASNSSIGGNVSSGAGVITLTNSQVRGTVTSGVAISVDGSSATEKSDLVITLPPACSTVVAGDIDHFDFSYAANALTCNPQPITVRACLDASCSSLFVDAVSLTLSPSSGWTATAPATLSGANTLLFSGGSATVQLRSSSPGELSLAVAGAVPAAKNGVVCSTSGCTLSYADSGFIFDVPTLIAARPQEGIWLSAVKKDDSSQACVPSFASVTRSLEFSSVYRFPDTGTESVWVNDSAVTSTPTALNLDFDSSGRAALAVRYDDAGQMTLNALYSGSAATDDSGLLMTGTDLFVSKPYGLLLQTDTDDDCSADINCLVFPYGVRAGDPFSLRIKAVAWQSDGETLTAAALADNPVTPNFTLDNIALSSQVQAPVDSSNGTVGATDSYNHALGNQTTVSRSISEVGVFKLTATPPANTYFGETVSGGTSGLVGRFIPAYLSVVGSASLTPSCVNPYPLKSFSYQGQPMGFATGQEPSLTVSGHNRAGDVTTNYDSGDFWRLDPPAVGAYASVTAEVDAADPSDLAMVAAVANRDARLTSQGPASPSVSGADSGDGVQVYRWSDEALLYAPAILPGSGDYPFQARIRQRFSAAALTDDDGACYLGDTSECKPFSYDFAELPGSQVRLGRLRIGNAHGSELQTLSLSVALEYWKNIGSLTVPLGSFQPELNDSCTASLLGTPKLVLSPLDTRTGQLLAKDIKPSVVSVPATPSLPINLQVAAPGSENYGSVEVSFPDLPSWLHYDWNGNGREAARGLATFGIYSAPTPLVFRRELYR